MIGNKGIILQSWLNAWEQLKNTLGVEFVANRDANNGYPGLSGFALKLKNSAGTITSFLTHQHTSAKTITFQDKNYTVAGIDDISNGYLVPIENFNPFVVRKQYSAAETNILCGRGGLLRLVVNGSVNSTAGEKLTNLIFEQTTVITGNSTDTILFDFVTNGFRPAGGVIYSAGRVFLNFYYNWIPESITARVQDNSGTWTDQTVSKIDQGEYVIEITNTYYAVALEVTLTGAVNNAYWALTQIQYHPYRMDGSDSPLINSASGFFGGKYVFNNKATFNIQQTYANNSDAVAAGLTAGMIYKTASGQIMVVY